MAKKTAKKTEKKEKKDPTFGESRLKFIKEAKKK